MARGAHAFDDAVPDIAADPGDYADGQLACQQDRALLDVQLEPCRKALWVDQWLSPFDSINVNADLAHARAEGEV